MNLIEISEQLKDVPDQYLVSEVQNPTGAYPAYLVVSELTRRKRMREGALKEKPETTVTEDLVGIAAAPEAADSTLGSAKQMMAQAPQMPTQLAGQMPQMPQMMSGGGLVAFEKGGPIRAFDGMFTGDYTQAITEEIPRASFINELSLSELQEYNRTGKVPERLSEKFGKTPTISSSDPNLYFKPTAPAVAAPVAAAPKPAPRTNAAPGAAPGAAPAPAAPTGIRAAAPQLPIDLQALLDTAKNEKGIPSEQERATARAEGAREFQEKLPFRQKEILERRIAERTEELQRDKKMSFNDALLAAGAAILSAPGGGTKWMGEGLKAFNQTMIEGKRDMRKAQQLIEQSEMDLAQAQMLRDQGEFAAADRREEKAFTRAEKARQFAYSEAALGLKAYEAQATAAKEMGMAEAYKATARTAGLAKVKPDEPPSFVDVIAFKTAYLNDYPKATKEQVEAATKNQFPGYRPMLAPEPTVRSVQGSGATLPQ